MNEPGWFYSELQQVGLDFEDDDQVATYDRNQGADQARDAGLVDRLALGGDDSVIDLGAGTGGFALAAARLCRAVHAVDVSRAMLRHARRKAESCGLGNLSFHRGGFLTYEHEGGPADVVVSRYALHHLPDFWKMAGLLRVAAMLRPGGLFYVEDVVFSFEPADYSAGIERWVETVAKPPGAGFTRDDFETHVREEHSTYSWILEPMLARAGFSIDSAGYSDGAYAWYHCRRGEKIE